MIEMDKKSLENLKLWSNTKECKLVVTTDGSSTTLVAWFDGIQPFYITSIEVLPELNERV